MLSSVSKKIKLAIAGVATVTALAGCKWELDGAHINNLAGWFVLPGGQNTGSHLVYVNGRTLKQHHYIGVQFDVNGPVYSVYNQKHPTGQVVKKSGTSVAGYIQDAVLGAIPYYEYSGWAVVPASEYTKIGTDGQGNDKYEITSWRTVFSPSSTGPATAWAPASTDWGACMTLSDYQNDQITTQDIANCDNGRLGMTDNTYSLYNPLNWNTPVPDDPNSGTNNWIVL